ncbi:MAG: B12-binding domain-containing radical SAM protein [Planctomycetes bacterium]|nr:B12-binding domain-containing radical SAM protein [Planctomycetota bacterium]
MRVWALNPPADHGVKQVREGRCMQRGGAWTTIWTPLSLAYCAAVAREDGHEAHLNDCIVEELDFVDVARRAAELKPDLVVMNAVTPSIDSDMTTVEAVKRGWPGAFVAVIGIHTSALPQDAFSRAPRLDAVIRGEPELTVRELLVALAAGKPVDEIAGLAVMRGGELKTNADRVPVENLDDLPFPAYDLINTDLYRMPYTDGRFLLVATGRGCPHPCVFCADHTYYGKKLRLRSAKNLVDELEYWGKKHGIREFLFWSEGFTLSPPRAKAVAKEIIARKLDIEWVCNSRVDDVDPELLGLFKQAGCTIIGFGVESGVQEMLDAMKKGTTVEQIRQAIDWAKAAKLQTAAHCMLGFPGETRQTIQRTVDFVRSLKLDFAQFYCAVPFPGCDLYDWAKEEGWIASDDYRKYEQNQSAMDIPGFTSEQIEAERSRAYKRFYLRPSMIGNHLSRLTSLKDIKVFGKMVKQFVSWV